MRAFCARAFRVRLVALTAVATLMLSAPAAAHEVRKDDLVWGPEQGFVWACAKSSAWINHQDGNFFGSATTRARWGGSGDPDDCSTGLTTPRECMWVGVAIRVDDHVNPLFLLDAHAAGGPYPQPPDTHYQQVSAESEAIALSQSDYQIVSAHAYMKDNCTVQVSDLNETDWQDGSHA